MENGGKKERTEGWNCTDVTPQGGCRTRSGMPGFLRVNRHSIPRASEAPQMLSKSKEGSQRLWS